MIKETNNVKVFLVVFYFLNHLKKSREISTSDPQQYKLYPIFYKQKPPLKLIIAKHFRRQSKVSSSTKVKQNFNSKIQSSLCSKSKI